MFRIVRTRGVAVLAIAAIAAAALAPPAALAQVEATPAAQASEAPKPAEVRLKPVKKVVVYFDDKAKGNGELRFALKPSSGDAMEIRVTVADGMDDEAVARAALKEFQVALDPKAYGLDLDDGTKVILKAKGDNPFTLVITTASVLGLKVELR